MARLESSTLWPRTVDPDDTQSRSRIQPPILSLMANLPNLSVVRDQARPKKLGRYELEESLGAEGGRETYRARVRGLAGFDRIFAVKCLRRASGLPLNRNDPFIKTAKRAASVTDARVARVLDADVIDGIAIVVTEYVHGLDLDRFREWAQVSGVLATGSDVSAEKWQKIVAYLGSEIAGALAAIHSLAPPFAHGGLSPRNVIATARGSIRVLDVGLGAAVQQGGDVLSSRSLAYAAPGPPNAEPTPAGDVRALGAMLFELGTGEAPQLGLTSEAAKSILDSHWPSMAEFLAGMLGEAPALRPSAARVAKVLSGYWADIPDASMIAELAALVRNFSAFVAEPSSTNAASPPAVQASHAEAVPAGASGLLAIPPPLPPGSSGSFLLANEEPTRMAPSGGYASALFRAASTDAIPPSAPGPASGPMPAPAPAPASVPPSVSPLVSVSRASAGPAVGRSPTIRSFAALASPAVSPSRPQPSAAVPPTMSPKMPMPAAPPAPPPSVVAPPRESEPSREIADWGAQALAALGTQAGVSVSRLVPLLDTAGLDARSPAPPPVSDPAIEEAFALAPLSSATAPPAAAPPVLAPGFAQAASAAASPPSRPQVFAPSLRKQTLEDELVDEEREPSLLSMSVASAEVAAVSDPETAFAEPAALSDDSVAEAPQGSGTALEATAFEAEDELLPAPDPASPRIALAMPASEAAQPRPPVMRSALRSRDGVAVSEDEVETWDAGMSRRKKIVIALVVVAGLGAVAAVLLLGPFAKSVAPPVPTSQAPRPPKAAVPAAPSGAPATKEAAKAATTTPQALAAVPAKTAAAAGLPAKAAVATPAKATPSALGPAAPPAAPAKPLALAPVAAVKEDASAKPALAGAVVRLRVASKPEGAMVWINGEERGSTPCTVDVKSGSARVVLVHAGYLTSQSSVEVREGGAIDETLKPVEPPMTGEARFRAECKTPGKLPVVVDGKETGILCPYSKMRVDPGVHTIGLLVPATGKVHQKEVTLFAGVRSILFGD
jgi:eukaryotic-like serine/threonine-protein kinase